MIPNLLLHTGWECSCPHAGAGSRCTFPVTGANPFAHTVTLMTPWLIQPSQPSCTCPEPTPGAGQDPTLPRVCWPPEKSTGPACFTPGNFTWSSCNDFILCKIETVCGTCMLHSLQKPFPPPTHCLKHLYKFYLNRKLEILFTICFSPKTASKINAQTLQEDINLTLTFFFFF